MLKFYYSPGACSLAAHIALEEAGALYEAVPLNLAQSDHKTAEYLEINPAGEVPALVIDNQPLTQNVAILTWIANSYPSAKLMPVGNRLAEARVISVMAWLSSTVHVNFKPQWASLFSEDADNGETVAAARRLSQQHLALIDGMLSRGDWLFGSFSVADGYLLPFYQWAADVFRYDMSKFPNYTKHIKRLTERPAVKRVLAREALAFSKAA